MMKLGDGGGRLTIDEAVVAARLEGWSKSAPAADPICQTSGPRWRAMGEKSRREAVMRWLPIGLLLLGCAVTTGDGDGSRSGMAELTFINGLKSYDITDIYYRLVDDPKYPGAPESFWRWHWGYREGPLEPGESVSFEVEPDLYDLRCVGRLGATYTRYDVEITEEGYIWEVTQEDRDDC
jgi:hypothetical protein